MSLREFTDERGRRWSVWDVHPHLTERRRRDAGPPGNRERRHHDERRLRLRSSLSQGWLAFESRDGERRRLAPIPEMPMGWDHATEFQLRSWCAMAAPAPPQRRLIE
jgi:hypothetical protein